jgi:hypothetical protein
MALLTLSTALPTDNIRRYYTESCNKITSHAIITDGLSVGNAVGNAVGTFKGNYRWIYSVGNIPAGNVFLVPVSVCITVSGWFFLFATELATEWDLPTIVIPTEVFRRYYFHRRNDSVGKTG